MITPSTTADNLTSNSNLAKEIAASAKNLNSTNGNGRVVQADSGKPTQIRTAKAIINFTDIGNATVFAKNHAADVRYSYTSRKWRIWDGPRWVIDEVGEIQRRAKKTVHGMQKTASKIKNEDKRKRAVRHALHSQNVGRINAMIALAQSEPGIPVLDRDLDSDPWLLNVKNGTLDLRTGTLRPHRREDLITKLVPVAYEPVATCPTWDAFLDRITNGDQEQITFVQKSIGYALTGDVSEQGIFILHGPGANGKSTFIKIIDTMLGDYALSTPAETLLVKRNSGIPNDVARLKGTRFVSAVESEHGRHLAEALVKQLTGGDRITARYLYAEFFDFDPTFKLFLAVNHKPTIRGSDYAIWRRINLIPFNVIIPPEQRDKRLITKLEAELPGILRWAVDGCLLWQAKGLEPPNSVKAATAAYQTEMDTIGDFIAECCDVDPRAETKFRDLFTRYRSWSSQNGNDFPDQKEFATSLTERGFQSARNNSLGRYRIGIRLKSP